ncbi:MAG: glycosyltransferase family 4 protein, partial [Acidimicrobiaceae bacterium]|nr:glycosyltransferase family 4 protein [Acidimicrobiaceae bacterium]
MRIAELCPYSLSVPGGVQGQVVALTRAMRRFGHEVDIIAPSDALPSTESFRSIGPSIRIPANGSRAPVGISPRALVRTASMVRDGGYEIVHIHEPFAPGPSLVGTIFSKVPVAGTFHRHGVTIPYRGLGWALSGFGSRLKLRFAVSVDAMLTARSVFGGQYQVVGNGVDLLAFDISPVWPKETPTVLFIGRHEHRKGLEVLIEAFMGIKDPELTCWIAGDGPQTPYLRSITTGDPRIVWLGRISDAEAMARMKAADVLCAPSLYGESFGVVLLEGLAAGSLVVATDIAGYRGVARDNVEAILVPPNDVELLGKALVKALTAEEFANGLRENGRKRALEFSID